MRQRAAILALATAKRLRRAAPIKNLGEGCRWRRRVFQDISKPGGVRTERDLEEFSFDFPAAAVHIKGVEPACRAERPATPHEGFASQCCEKRRAVEEVDDA